MNAPQNRSTRSNNQAPQGGQQRAVSQPAPEAAEGDGPQYFNLFTDGIGYLNDIRWVTFRDRPQDNFLAVRISALRGRIPTDSESRPKSTKYDLRVRGSDAIGLCEELIAFQERKQTIFVSFRLGDTYADAYMADEYDKHDQKTGRQVAKAVIKGALLLLKSVKIDGEIWYTRPDPEDTDGNPGGFDEGSGGDFQDSGFPGMESAPNVALAPQPHQRGSARPQNAPQRSRGQGERQRAAA